MTRTAVLFATVLALGACNKGPEVSAENASVEDVANQVAEARKGSDFVRPGKWSAKITFEEFNMPGAPAGTPAMLQKMNESTKATESCLTPEEAKRPKADFFAGDNKNCRYEHFNMGGGKIDAVMNCSGDEAVRKMTLAGTYGPDQYQMKMTMDGKGVSGAPAGMSMKMRVDAKRIGECDKGDA